MKQDKKTMQRFVELSAKVNEILRFGCWAADGKSATYKDLFRIQSYYFLFTFERKDEQRLRTLRQLKKSDFYAEKKKMLATKPRIGCENWSQDNKNYELKGYRNYTWKKVLPAENCTFMEPYWQKETKNPLKKRLLEALDELKDSPKPTTAAIGADFKQQIEQSAVLSKKMNIAYENVRAIGFDTGILQQFKESYEQALSKVEIMSPADRLYFHVALKPTHGRATRKKAVEELGIKFFGADVKRLNLSKLEELLAEYVEAYKEQSIKDAIAIAIAKEHDEREKLYNRMFSLSRTEKREILSELGVDINAIELNRYSLSPIKRALEASLGIGFEKN
jgi:hypothetical protein